jgi:hypothetical protein
MHLTKSQRRVTRAALNFKFQHLQKRYDKEKNPTAALNIKRDMQEIRNLLFVLI